MSSGSPSSSASSGHDFGQKQHQAARGGLRQRQARGIVGGNVPAGEVRDDARGQPAIGGDDRHAPLGHFQRLPHENGDGLRFLLGMRAFHQAHAGQAAPFRLQPHPRRGGLRRQEQVGDHRAARRRRGAGTGAVPRRHFLAGDAHAVQQQLEVILRVRHRVMGPERRVLRPGRIAGGAEFLPDVLRQREVEVGQHHAALGQFAHHPQQFRQRGRSAGDARRDDREDRRRQAPFAGGMLEQLVAPLRRVDLAARRQFRQPVLLHFQESTGVVGPVAGEFADHADHPLAHQVERGDPLDQQAVHRPAQFPRTAQQRRALARRIAVDFAQVMGQPQPAAGGIGSRRDVRRAERVEQRSQRLVKVEIAHHHHARQQQAGRLDAARMAHEGLGHRAHGAAAGQQQGQPG